MKTFEEKSRESYNKIADSYDNSLEGRFTAQFKKLLLEEVKVKWTPNARQEQTGNMC